MIPNEPVRGRIPPPWFNALSGIERVRAFSQGLVPWPPTARLLGTRTTHVAAGSATVAMPASDASVSPNGQLEITPLLVAALEIATTTALDAGLDMVPNRFGFDPFRPAYPRPGNLLARARVVHSGNLFVFAEVDVEDPDGRYLARGSLHSGIRRVEPAPPSPPDTMRPVDEPVYETPDPYLRSFPARRIDDFEAEDGLTALKRWADGDFKASALALYGVEPTEIAEGRIAARMPASEWFCALDHNVSRQVLAAFADMSAWTVAISLHRPGQSLVTLDSTTRFLLTTPADGRPLRSQSIIREVAPNLFVADTQIYNADDRLVVLHSGSCMRLDARRRTRRQRQESRRVLATLLFTDIVDSTGHAQRLGDAAWHALLEQHKLAVRREISRHNGTEIGTAGDGFFIRFDSPAQAIEAARATHNVTTPLGIEIRAGIHSGECELEGSRLAGMAVHIAARIEAEAAPGEILVSSTVRDLAVGSGTSFTDRGERQLKGVPDPWRVYAVAD